MPRTRLLGYCVGGLFLFSTVFTTAYIVFPDFRDGAHLFAGVILGQFVAVIIALATKEAISTEVKKRSEE